MTKNLRHLISVASAALLYCIVGCAEFPLDIAPPVSLTATSSLLFCTEGSVLNSGPYFEMIPGSTVITNAQSVARWSRELSIATSIPDYPGCGVLANLILLDSYKEPVALVSIVLYKCTVVIEPCRLISGKYLIDTTAKARPRQRIVRSEPFVRDIYAYMQVHLKEQLQKLNVFYDHDLEAMLFKGVVSGSTLKITNSDHDETTDP